MHFPSRLLTNMTTLEGAYRKMKDRIHVIMTVIVVLLTIVNCYPAAGHLMALKNYCDQTIINRGICIAFFILYTLALIFFLCYSIILGIKAVKNSLHFGFCSLVICSICLLYNIIPTILNAGIIFGFNVK